MVHGPGRRARNSGAQHAGEGSVAKIQGMESHSQCVSAVGGEQKLC